MAFRICRGDLRLPALAALGLGALGWVLGPGHLLEPVFTVFWKIIREIRRLFAAPWKKIFEKHENFVCIWAKIRYNRME